MLPGSTSPSASANAVWKTLGPSDVEGRAAKTGLLVGRLPSLLAQDTDAMQVDDAPRRCCLFPPPPPRTAFKKPRPSTPPGEPSRRQVSFHRAVDVRVSLDVPPSPSAVWFDRDELRSMRADAMKRHAPHRHSEQLIVSSDLQRRILESPPPPSTLPRVESANAELGSHTAQSPDAFDIRYQKLVSEIDREVYITNEERRDSTRRRIHHYNGVFSELDLQIYNGNVLIAVEELTQASIKASGDALNQALQRAQKEATLAQAVLMEKRLSMDRKR